MYAHLGVRQGVRGHKAKVHKTREHWTLLYCSLYPACRWLSLLKTTQRFHSTINVAPPQPSARLRGFESLEQRKALLSSFTSSAVSSTPGAALRSYSEAGQLQRLKRTICNNDSTVQLFFGIRPNWPPRIEPNPPQQASRTGRGLQAGMFRLAHLLARIFLQLPRHC